MAKPAAMQLYLRDHGKEVRKVQLPCRQACRTSGGNLPDMARTMVLLMARSHTLPAFARYHMACHVDLDSLTMGRAMRRVVRRHGGAQPKLTAFAWGLIRFAARLMAQPRDQSFGFHRMGHGDQKPIFTICRTERHRLNSRAKISPAMPGRELRGHHPRERPKSNPQPESPAMLVRVVLCRPWALIADDGPSAKP